MVKPNSTVDLGGVCGQGVRGGKNGKNEMMAYFIKVPMRGTHGISMGLIWVEYFNLYGLSGQCGVEIAKERQGRRTETGSMKEFESARCGQEIVEETRRNK